MARVHEFDLRGTGGLAVTFRGTNASELALLSHAEHPAIDIRLGGGDDRVNAPVTEAGSIVGGAGHDSLALLGHDLERGERVVADLARGTLAVTTGDTTTNDLTIPGFEDLLIKNLLDASISGTAADNALATDNVCTARLEGGRGDDTLGGTVDEALRPTDEPASWARCPVDPAARLLARGGPGDDDLSGWYGDDELLGGAGRDVANGAGGNDRCEAETRENCETP